MGKPVKLMAFLVFASSCLSAFCIAVMCITLMTGDFLGLKPYLMAELEYNQEPKSINKNEIPEGEEFTQNFVLELKKEKERLKEWETVLKDRERTIEILGESLKQSQTLVKKNEEEIRKLLNTIDKTEIENVKRISDVISDMEVKSGAKMLQEMKDIALAARVMYYMPKAKTAEILGEMLKTNSKTAADIADEMRKFVPELDEKKL